MRPDEAFAPESAREANSPGCVFVQMPQATKILQRKGKWSEPEELTLASLHRDLGNKWASISKHLEERSDSDVKNHWFSTLRSKSESKMKTFLWIYAHKVETVTESTSERQVVFKESKAKFLSITGREDILEGTSACESSGLDHESSGDHAVQLQTMPTSALSPSKTMPPKYKLGAEIKDLDSCMDLCALNTADQQAAADCAAPVLCDLDDPNLLNGDISDDLMLKLMGAIPASDLWAAPKTHQNVVVHQQPPAWKLEEAEPSTRLRFNNLAVTPSTTTATQQEVPYEANQMSAEDMDCINRKRRSSGSVNDSAMQIEHDWKLPSSKRRASLDVPRSDMCHETESRLQGHPEQVQVARASSGSEMMVGASALTAQAATGAAQLAGQAGGGIMCMLWIEHMRRQQAAKERVNMQVATGTSQAPQACILQMRRCKFHPFSNRSRSSSEVSCGGEQARLCGSASVHTPSVGSDNSRMQESESLGAPVAPLSPDHMPQAQGMQLLGETATNSAFPNRWNSSADPTSLAIRKDVSLTSKEVPALMDVAPQPYEIFEHDLVDPFLPFMDYDMDPLSSLSDWIS
eukprot:gene24498-10093_t